MKTKTRQPKIYEGEICLASSSYTWRNCLISIDKVTKKHIMGKVIATEKPAELEEYVMEHQLEYPDDYWRFKRGELLRRIQKSH